VTYLFAGAIDHRDSLGTHARIEPGAVNLMTAGRGIVHSERSPADQRPGGPELSGIQTWLALPTAKEEIGPAFEHVARDALPVVIYADIALQAGGSMPIDAGADERAVYLAEGDASLDDIELEPRILYLLRPGVAATLRTVGGGHVMLAGGAPLDGPRHVWWNFVSSSRERIMQAREDWQAMRFPVVPGDDVERIPLPEVPTTVSYP
jgi:redox-sensitive bicupin YhaK (pirin superfamily)